MMTMTTAVPNIDLLPDDVRGLIFYYCGDVTRAWVCSVSSRWHADVIAVSSRNCSIPALYYRKSVIINKHILQVIFADYHLVVRYKIPLNISLPNIFHSTLKYQMCKANNADVYDLYSKLQSNYVPLNGEFYIEKYL